MINQFFDNLTPENQGNILIISGALLVLNAFGIITFNIVLAAIGLAMIWYGCTRASYIQRLKDWMKR